MAHRRTRGQTDPWEDISRTASGEAEPAESQRVFRNGAVAHERIRDNHEDISRPKLINVRFALEKTAPAGNVMYQIAIPGMWIHYKIRGTFFQTTVIKFQVKMDIRIAIGFNFHKQHLRYVG